MKKIRNMGEEQRLSDFNMSIADMMRLDSIIKRVNLCIYRSAVFGWKKYLIHLMAALIAMYENIRYIAKDEDKKRFDDKFKILEARIYLDKKINYMTYRELLALFRELMDLRQKVGLGFRLKASEKDYTDDILVV